MTKSSGFVEVSRLPLESRVYVPTYWPDVIDTAPINSFEAELVKNLVCLPLDQRYDLSDMCDMLTRLGF